MKTLCRIKWDRISGCIQPDSCLRTPPRTPLNCLLNKLLSYSTALSFRDDEKMAKIPEVSDHHHTSNLIRHKVFQVDRSTRVFAPTLQILADVRNESSFFVHRRVDASGDTVNDQALNFRQIR
jgi:hypothetical protein